jgi:hypothetical protein
LAGEDSDGNPYFYSLNTDNILFKDIVFMEKDTSLKEVLKRICETPASHRKIEKKFKVLNLAFLLDSSDYLTSLFFDTVYNACKKPVFVRKPRICCGDHKH